MNSRIWQCAMLVLLIFSCYGYLRAVLRLFKLRVEFAVFILFSAIGLAMTLAGIIGALVPCAYFIFSLGLVLAAFSAVRRESLKSLISCGSIFFCIFSVFALFLLYNTKLAHVDNFSHWGAIIKIIFREDKLPAYDPLVYFPAYPPGSSLLIYYFSRISGIRAEWFWTYTQSLYLVSCSLAVFCFAGFWEKRKKAALYLLSTIFALSLMCSDIDFSDLLVDTLVPMLGLAGVLMCCFYRDCLAAKRLPLLIIVCFLPMIKNSGYYMSAVIIAHIFAFTKEKRMRETLLFLAALLLINRLWAWHVNTINPAFHAYYHGLSLDSFRAAFLEKSPEDLYEITVNFGRALIANGRVLRFAAALLVTSLAIFYCDGWKKQQYKFILAAFGIWFGYIVCLLGMYFFSMSVGEARGVAAFDRYYRSIALFTAGYLWMILLAAIKAAPSGKENFKLLSASIACAAMLMLSSPNYTYYIRQTYRKESESLSMRNEFDRLIETYKIPSGMTYVLFIGEDDSDVIARVLSTYLLSPQSTVVYRDENIADAYEAAKTMDYYIILNETDENRRFLEQLGKNGAAGYLY